MLWRFPVSALLALSSLFAADAQAAACCAGNSAVPSLITGDEAQVLGIGLSASSVIGDAPSDGWATWRGTSNAEISRIFRLEAATLIGDSTQLGLTVPVTVHTFGTQSATALGDLRLSAALEIRSENGYADPWPKGFGYIAVTLPTGTSALETTSAARITGQGAWGLALGTYWVRRRPPWDLGFLIQAGVGLDRTFADGVTYAPGWSGTTMVSGGFAPGRGDLRLGLRAQPVYQQGRRTRTADGDSVGSYSLTWDLGADVTWMFTDSWTASLSYTDQTLLGPAVNSTLSRTFAFFVQRQFLR